MCRIARLIHFIELAAIFIAATWLLPVSRAEVIYDPTGDPPDHPATLTSIIQVDGVVLAGGNSARILRSTDGGLSFESITHPASAQSSVGFRGFAASPDEIIAIGTISSVILKSTDLGLTWTNVGTPVTPISNRLQAVTYNDGVFAAVGFGGKIFTSHDHGESWVARNSQTTNDLEDISTLGDAFVAVTWGRDSAIAPKPAETIISTNGGLSWTQKKSNQNIAFYSVGAFDGDLYVASQYGKIFRSTNLGDSWQEMATPTSERLLSIASSDRSLVAAGENGALLQFIPELDEWSLLPPPLAYTYWATEFLGEAFWSAGFGGVIVTSPELLYLEPSHLEISIDQSSVGNLIDGDSTISFPGLIPNVTSSLTLTIRNAGTEALAGLEAIIGGTHAADFEAGPLGSNSLQPNETTTVDLSFIPTLIGQKTATFQIVSSDVNENPFDLVLAGNVIEGTTILDWGTSFGLSGNSLLVTADDDGDSSTLLEEYAFNLDPTLRDHAIIEPGSGSSGIPSIRIVNDRLEVEYLARVSDSNLHLEVQFGDSPADASLIPATEPVFITPVNERFERRRVTDSQTTGASSARFARVKVVLNEP